LPEPIYVTRPFLPPLSEFLPMLEEIWATRVLTNSGPFHTRLEAKLANLFGVEHVSLVTNGMVALTAAIEACAIEGEVITTPYSFVATTHAVKMGQLTPVFVDVRPSDLNIDPARIEEAITPRTSAIVAVHVYGNPCDVDAIEQIASRHGLKVIYDAAHAFGVRHNGRSVLSHGDFATLSFHATKAFNTFEGGAIISRTPGGKGAVDGLMLHWACSSSIISIMCAASVAVSMRSIESCSRTSMASNPWRFPTALSRTTPISRSWFEPAFGRIAMAFTNS
jgi:dTDP-4-amino-4,6-dideoxygalactose transaminase